jgi:hypothetical protein
MTAAASSTSSAPDVSITQTMPGDVERISRRTSFDAAAIGQPDVEDGDVTRRIDVRPGVEQRPVGV